MSDELREAAERLRKNEYPQCNNPGAYTKKDRDNGILADAYLAEHPADSDELVTEEWLRIVGFDQHGLAGLNLLVPQGDNLRLYIDTDLDPARASVGQDYHMVYLPTKMRTRGDVRRLCAALGVPLK